MKIYFTYDFPKPNHMNVFEKFTLSFKVQCVFEQQK